MLCHGRCGKPSNSSVRWCSALDEGPQVVTRHGEKVVVVLSAREYRRPTVAAPNFKEFLLAAPDLHQLELRRPDDQARIVEL